MAANSGPGKAVGSQAVFLQGFVKRLQTHKQFGFNELHHLKKTPSRRPFSHQSRLRLWLALTAQMPRASLLEWVVSGSLSTLPI